MKAEKKFKGGGRVEMWLRFFSLLEPGHMVLSISKVFMWLGGLVVLNGFWTVAHYAPQFIGEAGFGGATLLTALIAGYVIRRDQEVKVPPSWPVSRPPAETAPVVKPPDKAQDDALNKV